MRWEDGRRSSNVEDRRGGGRTVKRAGGIGVGGILLVLVVMYMGGDPSLVLGALEQQNSATTRSAAPPPPGQDKLADFVSVILADTEDVWSTLIPGYRAPKLVLFRDSVDSACGFTSAAVGPFYCPADHKAYIDLSFYDQLRRQFGAPGDFAQAYVLAHEVGHHVQNLTGVSTKVHQARQRSSKTEGNKLSVMQELQADCYAGVWAHHAHAQRQLLEEGDVQEGLRAAAAIGDDALQKQSTGRVVPDAFTHGSSEQRVRWFGIGIQSGDPNKCDTFSASSL